MLRSRSNTSPGGGTNFLPNPFPPQFRTLPEEAFVGAKGIRQYANRQSPPSALSSRRRAPACRSASPPKRIRPAAGSDASRMKGVKPPVRVHSGLGACTWGGGVHGSVSSYGPVGQCPPNADSGNKDLTPIGQHEYTPFGSCRTHTSAPGTPLSMYCQGCVPVGSPPLAVAGWVRWRRAGLAAARSPRCERTRDGPGQRSGLQRPEQGELIAWSRLLYQTEVLVCLNTQGEQGRGPFVTVDAGLHPARSSMTVLYRGNWSDVQLRQPPAETATVEDRGGRSAVRVDLPAASVTWLVTEEILSEYEVVLTRLGVRRNLVGEIVNLLREEAEFVAVRGEVDVSPDPDDNAFCACSEPLRHLLFSFQNGLDSRPR